MVHVYCVYIHNRIPLGNGKSNSAVFAATGGGTRSYHVELSESKGAQIGDLSHSGVEYKETKYGNKEANGREY